MDSGNVNRFAETSEDGFALSMVGTWVLDFLWCFLSRRGEDFGLVSPASTLEPFNPGIAQCALPLPTCALYRMIKQVETGQYTPIWKSDSCVHHAVRS